MKGLDIAFDGLHSATAPNTIDTKVSRKDEIELISAVLLISAFTAFIFTS